MKTYLRILAFGKPFFRTGFLAILFLLLTSFFSVFSITLVIPFLQIIFRTNESALEQAMAAVQPTQEQQFRVQVQQWITDYGEWKVLVVFCIVLLTSIFLKGLFKYLSSWFIAPFEQGVINNIRRRLFDHLSVMSMPFFTGNRKGNIINVMVTDAVIVQESVIGTVQNMVADPMLILITLAALFMMNWKLTLFSLLVLPVTGFFISRISRTLKKKARGGQERLGNLIGVLDEFITGIRVVKSFVTEGHERLKYARQNNDYSRFMISLKRRSDLASPVTEFLAMLVVCCVILYGGNLILSGSGDLDPAFFIGFIALFGTLIAPMKTFSGALSRIQKGIASFQRIEHFLAEEETVKEKPDARALPEFRESIRFDGVHFKYEDEFVLKNISFEIRKGETVALVGPSGSGKSTMADLLPRFYDVTLGKITVDGNDVRDVRARDLRGLIGMVTQEGVLFNDTVTANIAYGDARPDMERVKQAAAVANAAGFIEALPSGYDTEIGERGTKLSGGQRQRLAIARAVYKNAPILILDEATSALDSESEKLVQEALDALRVNRTSLVIAHRLSTIQNAHRILVVDKGEIVEAGTHESLIRAGGLYKKLHEMQFRWNETES